MSVSGSGVEAASQAGDKEEYVVPQNAFTLQDDIPDADLDPEWHALVSQQAYTLAAMLQRIQTAVAKADPCTDAPRLLALAANAEQLLTVQAQQHVSLERELVQLRALVADVHTAPATLT
jgi:hypothetical protein